MFGNKISMALTRPSVAMQLTSGVDVFVHVCWQKADTSSNYCDSIQSRDKTFQFLSNVTQFLHCFFYKLPQIRTSNFRKVMQQHTEGMRWEVLYGFSWKFSSSYSSCRILKMHQELTKVIAMSLV